MTRVLVCLAVTAALAGSTAALAANPGAKKLPGIWITTLKGKKPASLNGDWAIQFKKNGDYRIVKHVVNTNTAKRMVDGQAFLFGTRGIEFKNEKGPAACKGKQAIGRYTWSVIGKTLRFTRLRDTCIGRRTVLGGVFRNVA